MESIFFLCKKKLNENGDTLCIKKKLIIFIDCYLIKQKKRDFENVTLLLLWF
jgi:hypothetical protein